MARCPYCMAVNPASASICYSCGRVILGAGGMAMRIEPNLPGGHMVHGVRKGPPPGLNVRRGGKRRAKKKKSNLRSMIMGVAIAFLFLFTPAQERISTQLEKWLDTLLDEFGPAREYPVYAAYTVERNVHLVNPHSQSISFSYELPIPETRTDFGVSDYGFESADGSFSYPVVTLQEVANMVAKVEGGIDVIIPIDVQYLGEGDAIQLDSSTEIYWPPVGQSADRCSVALSLIHI